MDNKMISISSDSDCSASEQEKGRIEVCSSSDSDSDSSGPEIVLEKKKKIESLSDSDSSSPEIVKEKRKKRSDSSSSDSVSSCSDSSSSSVIKEENTIPLSDEQQCAIDAVRKGKSIFITGSAGVGKSFVLKEILKILPKESTFVTASTGVAACNIGGTTVHNFAGIGLGQKSAATLAGYIMNSRKDAYDRWMKCRVLVIDEISMIDGILFRKVEKIASIVRKDSHPFGGIQVILCGDFLQLPPVKSEQFAFETKCWSAVVQETIVLKKVFRQKEVGFIKLLNRLRTGAVTQLDIDVLNTCKLTKFINDGIKATRLFPLKCACNEINSQELRKLKGPTVTYSSVDTAVNKNFRQMLERNSRFVSELKLRYGAQVMLLVNKDVSRHLVNGSRGVVIGFRDNSKLLHDDVLECLKKWNENNAVSSVRDEDLLSMVHNNEEVVKQEHFIVEKRNPIVLFASGVVDVIYVERLTVKIGGRVVASRVQMPLMLAWAVSIHKSQGTTLDRVHVSLADAFEHGQSYVALSRVTSLDGLLIQDFDPEKITAHPKVLLYYKKIDPDFSKPSTDGNEDLKAFVRSRSESNCLTEVKGLNSNNASNHKKTGEDTENSKFESVLKRCKKPLAKTKPLNSFGDSKKSCSNNFNSSKSDNNQPSNNLSSAKKSHLLPSLKRKHTGIVDVVTNSKKVPDEESKEGEAIN